MNLFAGGRVISSALTAQRQRFEAILTNLANAETTRTPEGGPYRKRSVIFESVPLEQSFDSVYRSELTGSLSAVRVTDISIDDGPPLQRYDPSHPHADASGYVAYPNVDPAAEMVDLLETTRSFQALVAGMGALRDMVMRSLDLGR